LAAPFSALEIGPALELGRFVASLPPTPRVLKIISMSSRLAFSCLGVAKSSPDRAAGVDRPELEALERAVALDEGEAPLFRRGGGANFNTYSIAPPLPFLVTSMVSGFWAPNSTPPVPETIRGLLEGRGDVEEAARVIAIDFLGEF